MPIHSSLELKRQTQALRRRITTLTRYEPESLTSEEEPVEESDSQAHHNSFQKLGGAASNPILSASMTGTPSPILVETGKRIR